MSEHVVEVRCESKLWGILIDDGVLEVKCNSAFCGAGKGVVVLHRFSLDDGTLIETKRFKEPGRSRAHGSDNHSAAVRSA
jgi:hypothetical protein